MDFLLECWDKVLEPLVSGLGGTYLFWRWTSLFLFTLLITLFLFRKQLAAWVSHEKYVEHDKARFAAIIAIMNEKEMRDFLAEINRHLIISDDDYKLATHLAENTFLPESRFLIPKLSNSYARFLLDFYELMNFIKENFLHNDNSHMFKYKAGIDLNSGTQQEQAHYRSEQDKLRKISISCLKRYDTFRDAVKKELLV
jgi:hypothetical protein